MMSLPTHLVHDILVNLPLKSLMRFKCVSKSCQSLTQDSSFVELYLARSKRRPQLLIYTRAGYNYDSTIICSPEDGFNGGVAVHKVSIPPSQGYMLTPIDGLFCFVDKLNGVTRIFNLGTRQITPWAKVNRRALAEEAPHRVHKVLASYGFGFDPLSKTYKVLCVWNISRRPSNKHTDDEWKREEHVCEILTVGENQWRKIDEVPPAVELRGDGVYANGSIYWWDDDSDGIIPPDDFIVAFDVGTEKFRVIQIPGFIVDSLIFDSYLLQIDGHIALVEIRYKRELDWWCLVKLWISDDDSYKEEKKLKTNWRTEETIWLPCSCAEEGCLVYPIDGTNELLIKTCVPDHERSLNCVLSLSIYDRVTKSFRKIYITGVSISMSSMLDLFGYDMFVYHESVVPIQKPGREEEEELNETIHDWFEDGRFSYPW